MAVQDILKFYIYLYDSFCITTKDWFPGQIKSLLRKLCFLERQRES